MTLYQRYQRLTFWNKLGVIASILTVITFVPWLISWLIPERSKPSPHFTLSLVIGDSPAICVLTNDILFNQHIASVGEVFRGSANGCLVVPVQPGESNIVFNFIAENDSPVKVTDLQVAVGFPSDWECGLDTTKWHKVGQHLIIPGAWKLEITNLQFWVTQSPWVLFPTDRLRIPSVTNPCIYTYNGSTIKAGFVELTVRSADFESLLGAQIAFIPASSNETFKPFVTSLKHGADGRFHLSVSQKEFEDSQK
jgi:hypothetical protein